jgi:hypothetical protein
MATWIDGGPNPPRPGYYAEEAEDALRRARAAPEGRVGVKSAIEAETYATLELAAATERAAVAESARSFRRTGSP